MSKFRPVLWMLVGVPCAGKTTWISTNFPDLTGKYHASTDRLIEIYAKMRGTTYDAIFKETADMAHGAMYSHINDAIMYRNDIIWDQTNLNKKSRRFKLTKIPSEYQKIAVVFKTPDREELDRRLVSRPGKTIPKHIIDSMITSFEHPEYDEGFNVICTVD